MAEENAGRGNGQTKEATKSFSLRDTIRSSREFLNRTIMTARTHSPLADDKLEAVDNTISGVIHTGYQAVKKVLVQGHPAVILTAVGLAAAAPSYKFGARVLVRNTCMTMALAAVMIYPDHLKPSPSAVSKAGRSTGKTA